MIKVMIVDNHDLVCNAITALLSDIPDIKVIAKAKTGEEAIRLAKQHQPAASTQRYPHGYSHAWH